MGVDFEQLLLAFRFLEGMFEKMSKRKQNVQQNAHARMCTFAALQTVFVNDGAEEAVRDFQCVFDSKNEKVKLNREQPFRFSTWLVLAYEVCSGQGAKAQWWEKLSVGKESGTCAATALLELSKRLKQFELIGPKKPWQQLLTLANELQHNVQATKTFQFVKDKADLERQGKEEADSPASIQRFNNYLHMIFHMVRECETIKTVKGSCQVCQLPVLDTHPHEILGAQGEVAHLSCAESDIAIKPKQLGLCRDCKMPLTDSDIFKTDSNGRKHHRKCPPKKPVGSGGGDADEVESMEEEEKEQQLAADALLEHFIPLPTTPLLKAPELTRCNSRRTSVSNTSMAASALVDPVPRKPKSTAGICEQVLSEGGKTFALHGEEGCGKSSLCAQLALKAREQKMRFVHLHFAEKTRHGRNPVFAIRRIVHKLKVSLALEMKIPETLEEAPQALNRALSRAGERLRELDGRGLIILDGVDKLDDIDGAGALALAWVKRPMPARISLVFTYADAKRRWLDFVQRKALPSLVELHVPVPTLDDAMQMVDRYFMLKKGVLTPGQREMLRVWLSRVDEYPYDQQKFADRRRPLMLSMLREELLSLGGNDKEKEDKTRALLKDKSIELMRAMMEQRAEGGDGEALKLVLCLVACAPGGLEKEELQQCLKWARGVPGIPQLRTCLEPLGAVEEEAEAEVRLLLERAPTAGLKDVLEALAPFTRVVRAGSSSERFSAKNNLVERAVRAAWLSSREDGGRRRRRTVLRLLEGCLGRALLGTERLPPEALPAVKERKSQSLLALPDILQAQAAEEGGEDRLRTFLQRLDVFLELYKQENRSRVLRFGSVLDTAETFYLKDQRLDKDVLKRLRSSGDELWKQLEDCHNRLDTMPRKAVFLQRLSEELCKPDADFAEVMQKYVKVAGFLMAVGPPAWDGAYTVLIEGLAGAAERLVQDAAMRARVEAQVVKLFIMLNTLLGRHRYNGEKWKDQVWKLQNTLLEEAKRRADCLPEGEEKTIHTAQILSGQGYLYLFRDSSPTNQPKDKFEEAMRVLMGDESWDEVLAFITRAPLSSTHISELAETLNALGTAFEKEFKKNDEKLMTRVEQGKINEEQMGRRRERNEDFIKAHRAYALSLELGDLVSDESVGRSYMSLGNLYDLADDWDEAEKSLEQSIEAFQRGLGSEHQRIALPCYTLAKVLHQQGKLREAEAMAERAVDVCERSGATIKGKAKELLDKIVDEQAAVKQQTEEGDKGRVWAEHREKSHLLFDGCASPAAAIQLHKELRVFVSSTFKDFQEEREQLVRGVFPELRALCQERGVNLVEIDFRTGVTMEQGEKGQVLEICLNEVMRSQYFVSMQGMRYGWCKAEEGVSEFGAEEEKLKKTFENAISKFPQFSQILKKYSDRSITELEIRAAALNVKKEDRLGRRVWFHLRKDDYMHDDPEFREEADTSSKRLKNLRQAMALFSQQERPGRAYQYNSPEQVFSRIRKELMAALEEDLPVQSFGALEKEDWEQSQAAARLRGDFLPLSHAGAKREADKALKIARKEVEDRKQQLMEAEKKVTELEELQDRAPQPESPQASDEQNAQISRSLSADEQAIEQQLLSWAENGEAGKKLALAGSPGSGKSSLCAQLAAEAEARPEVAFVHLHLAECSQMGNNPVVVMRRLIQSISAQLKLEGLSRPTTLDKVSQALNLAMRAASASLKESGKKGVIIFDGLDGLEMRQYGLLAFSWMQREMPSQINLLVSCTDGAADQPADRTVAANDGAGVESGKFLTEFLGKRFMRLEVPLPSVDRSTAIVHQLLQRHSKKLEDNQKASLVTRLQHTDTARSPFTLFMLSEELRMMGDFEERFQRTESVAGHAASCQLLCEHVLLERIRSVAPKTPNKSKGTRTLLAVVGSEPDRSEPDRAPLLHMVLSLLSLAHDGLEVDSELQQCLYHAHTKFRKPRYERMEVEFALAQLAPFTRRIGSIPPRLAPRNRVMVQAVDQMTKHLKETGEADKYMTISWNKDMLELLESVFSTYKGSRERGGRLVTAREAAELPFVLQQLLELGDTEAKERLAGVLHRLDVFLHLYRHENKDDLLRFTGDGLVARESFVTDGKAVYQEALEVALSLAETREQAAEALGNFIKVAKFLLEVRLLEGAYSVLQQGVMAAEELLQVGEDGEGARDMARVAAALITMLCTLNTLYNRYKFRKPVDDDMYGPRNGLPLLVQARKLLSMLEDGGEERTMLTAEVLQGIGYIYLNTTSVEHHKQLQLDPKKTALHWFVEVLSELTATVLEPDQAGANRVALLGDDLDAAPQGLRKVVQLLQDSKRVASLSTDRIQAFADVLNAIGTACQRRRSDKWFEWFAHMKVAYEASLHGVVSRRTGDEWFAHAKEAYEASVDLGKLLNDTFVGRSLMSLGELYLENNNPEEAIEVLKESKQCYINGLGKGHVRGAWATHALAKAYSQIKPPQTQDAVREAQEAVEARRALWNGVGEKPDELRASEKLLLEVQGKDAAA